MKTILWKRGRFALIFNLRDWRLGPHFGEDALYLSLLPALVLRWQWR